MGCAAERSFPRRALHAVAVVAVLVILGGHLPTGLQAQTWAGAIPDLSAVWTRSGRPVAPSELPLTARGIGMREAFDEALHPMYDCVPAPIPFIIGDPYNFSIEQRPDRVIISYEKDDIVRTVWLEGKGHPAPTNNDFSILGYSSGRYEGSTLVVETTKYAFDPAGIEDKPPIVPSSTSKKTVERYTREGDRLVVDVVVEDPLILAKPVNYRFQFVPTDQPLSEWIPCDPAHARAPLRYMPEEALKYGR